MVGTKRSFKTKQQFVDGEVRELYGAAGSGGAREGAGRKPGSHATTKGKLAKGSVTESKGGKSNGGSKKSPEDIKASSKAQMEKIEAEHEALVKTISQQKRDTFEEIGRFKAEHPEAFQAWKQAKYESAHPEHYVDGQGNKYGSYVIKASEDEGFGTDMSDTEGLSGMDYGDFRSVGSGEVYVHFDQKTGRIVSIGDKVLAVNAIGKGATGSSLQANLDTANDINTFWYANAPGIVDTQPAEFVHLRNPESKTGLYRGTESTIVNTEYGKEFYQNTPSAVIIRDPVAYAAYNAHIASQEVITSTGFKFMPLQTDAPADPHALLVATELRSQYGGDIGVANKVAEVAADIKNNPATAPSMTLTAATAAAKAYNKEQDSRPLKMRIKYPTEYKTAADYMLEAYEEPKRFLTKAEISNG